MNYSTPKSDLQATNFRGNLFQNNQRASALRACAIRSRISRCRARCSTLVAREEELGGFGPLGGSFVQQSWRFYTTSAASGTVGGGVWRGILMALIRTSPPVLSNWITKNQNMLLALQNCFELAFLHSSLRLVKGTAKASICCRLAR